MASDYFSGKVALVTGSARGIGLAAARLLGDRGARVVLSDVLEETLAEAEERLKGVGIEVFASRSDVTKPEECEALVTSAIDRFGRLDVLVNNAGLSIVADLEACRPEACKKLVDVNILGSIYMTLAALDALKQAKGNLVFVSSVSGLRAIPTGSVYSASKAFLRSLAESLRLELRAAGSDIRVSAISPGFVETEFAEVFSRDPAAAEATYGRFPVLQPEDVAEMVRFVLSNPAHVQVHDLLVRPTRQVS